MAKRTVLPEYPQKKYLKWIFTFLFYLGTGDTWYEKRNLSRKNEILYKLWYILTNVYSFGFVLNEYIAYCRTDLTLQESNELKQFMLAHTSVMGKIALLQLQRNRIKVVVERFIEKNKEFNYLELQRESLRWATIYSMIIVCSSFFTLLFTLLDAFVAHFRFGLPLQTEIVYFPDAMFSRDLLFTKIFRFFIEFHWWFIVLMMALIDCISVTALIFLKYKFKNLNKYFKDLKTIFENPIDTEHTEMMEKEFEEKFVIGVRLHAEVLWCASKIQYALGNFYSTQVFESITLLVMCLIRLVTTERSVSFLVANLMYIVCMVNLTGVYMMAGGGITLEASQLPQAIFESGWHLSSCNKRVRTLIVMSIIRSQVPVYMTSFGIITLSYTNFILIIRHSYSFFAVLY